MDKIKTIKVKNEDGTIDENAYYISVDANNVEMSNNETVQDVIGNINPDTDGTIADQIKKLKQRIKALEDKVNN